MTVRDIRPLRRDGCCVPASCSVRSADGHITEESFVVVGRKSNNIKDGVSQRRRKKRDNTFDIKTKVQSSKHRCQSSLESSAVAVSQVHQLHSWGGSPNSILVVISYWSLFSQSTTSSVPQPLRSPLLAHLPRGGSAVAAPVHHSCSGPLATPRRASTCCSPFFLVSSQAHSNPEYRHFVEAEAHCGPAAPESCASSQLYISRVDRGSARQKKSRHHEQTKCFPRLFCGTIQNVRVYFTFVCCGGQGRENIPNDVW